MYMHRLVCFPRRNSGRFDISFGNICNFSQPEEYTIPGNNSQIPDFIQTGKTAGCFYSQTVPVGFYGTSIYNIVLSGKCLSYVCYGQLTLRQPGRIYFHLYSPALQTEQIHLWHIHKQLWHAHI